MHRKDKISPFGRNDSFENFGFFRILNCWRRKVASK
jgi:hypothetical protein